MNKLIFTFLISTFLISVSSCKKEEEQEPGPCETVICENGGMCDEQGTCNCPPEFEGTNCENLAKPKEIKINKVIVTDFQQTNNSAEEWDTDSGPDLYLVFSKIDNTLSIAETETLSNCEFGNEYEFPVEWTMDGADPVYYFYLLDDDGDIQSDSIQIIGNADFMGELMIQPLDFRENKPTTIELPPQLNYGFGIRLEVEWIFE